MLLVVHTNAYANSQNLQLAPSHYHCSFVCRRFPRCRITRGEILFVQVFRLIEKPNDNTVDGCFISIKNNVALLLLLLLQGYLFLLVVLRLI